MRLKTGVGMTEGFLRLQLTGVSLLQERSATQTYDYASCALSIPAAPGLGAPGYV